MRQTTYSEAVMSIKGSIKQEEVKEGKGKLEEVENLVDPYARGPQNRNP